MEKIKDSGLRVRLKNSKIRVRCLECKEEHFIDLNIIGFDKERRSFGYEYEYTFSGDMVCTHCGEQMRTLIIVYEYPKDFINYIDNSDEGCLIMEDVTEESLILTEDK